MRHIDADKIDLRMPHVVDERGNILVLLSDVKQAITMVPAADVVLKDVYEQFKRDLDEAKKRLVSSSEPFDCEVFDAVEVVDVVHGEWIPKDCIVRSPFARNYYCSVCKYEPLETKNYCPECGAKMDGGKVQS